MYSKKCPTTADLGDQFVYERCQLGFGEVISDLAEYDQIELTGWHLVWHRCAHNVDVCSGAAALTRPIDCDAGDLHRLYLVTDGS
ncbi:hypothetical protein HDF11_000464 [Tunturiibacter psychrotolerans]